MSNGGGSCRAQKARGRTSSRRHDEYPQGKVTRCVAYRIPKGFGTTGGAHRGGLTPPAARKSIGPLSRGRLQTCISNAKTPPVVNENDLILQPHGNGDL